MEIVEYSEAWENEWDSFVEKISINGTFMQTRRFINYHPNGRFIDNSLLFKDKKIQAVCPACQILEDGKKIFYSHAGMTFAGIILRNECYQLQKLFELMDTLEAYFAMHKYDKIILKITPHIFSERNTALLEYALQYYGYMVYTELNTYVDLTKDINYIWNRIDRNKKRALKKVQQENLIFRELKTDNEVCLFYHLLVKNLQKHNILPIHTMNEILDFKNQRLKDETKFYGVFQNERMLAGGMLFSFSNRNILHAQNLSADTDYMDSGAITFLYYSVICEAKRMGYDKLSWGISTEKSGTVINRGLIRNKESYGSEYYLNYTYVKQMRTDNGGEKIE